jgi:hypothetical protein
VVVPFSDVKLILMYVPLILSIKSGLFDQPDLFDPIWTRHFLQYARRARARISSSSHAYIMFS